MHDCLYTGVVATLAGIGTLTWADGLGAVAIFNSPTGVSVDSNGDVYVADKINHRIRKVSSSGVYGGHWVPPPHIEHELCAVADQLLMYSV